MIEIIIMCILSIVSIGTLCFICINRDLITAAVGTTLISLIASIMFVIMRAPDVAMTEASIGAALSGAIIIGIIIKVRRRDR